MLLIRLIHFVMAASVTPSFAHCPNPFVFNDTSFCADFDWEETEVLKGQPLMSPVLNTNNQKPFEQHLSNFWINIWASGDASHKVLSLKDLKISPFMLMSDMPHHHGALKSGVEFVKGKGYFVSGLNFMKMQGCWSITIESTQLFHLMPITHFSNLDDDQNSEQKRMCSFLTEAFFTEEPAKPHGPKNSSDHSKH